MSHKRAEDSLQKNPCAVWVVFIETQDRMTGAVVFDEIPDTEVQYSLRSSSRVKIHSVQQQNSFTNVQIDDQVKLKQGKATVAIQS